MSDSGNTGKVIIAGAGPGDVELITLKLQKRLAEAEVIIVDRLVNPEIIDQFASPHALTLMTGKQGYHDGSVAQEDINKLLIGHAKNGKTVLRLKGGDVAFYSNVLDELICLHENNIPFEIIPGITAASGASAYTGIPLTARGYSKNVKFITFNPCSEYDMDELKSLAGTKDTIVCYMSARNLFSLTGLLLKYSMKPAMPIAVIEQASTIYQKVNISTVGECRKDFEGRSFGSPSIVIIGEVVNLHSTFNWYKTEKAKGSVFPELLIKQDQLCSQRKD